MLDVEHPSLPTQDGDSTIYTLGEVQNHNIVLACLPGSQGKGAAAIIATHLTRTFPCIKWRFMVGIGGGVPSAKHDIRLGDVVVSMPEGKHGGVVQYDLGKDTDSKFDLKGFLMPPPPLLRSAVLKMRSDHRVRDSQVEDNLAAMLRKGRRLAVYQRPAQETDVLFRTDYPHPSGPATCDGCDTLKTVQRSARDFEGPEIHYGLIASGDRVIRSATNRNEIIRNLGDILCFEMEAAGLASEHSCIVIRGISDYSDSHKNDEWQHYAAATAAACAKELLSYIK
jgi:nucleoside phosphorylase